MTRPCPGPIAPRQPKRTPPPGTCDSHIHIIGPYGRFPLNEDRSYTAPEAPAAAYRRVMQQLGIERAVVVHPSCHGLDLAVTFNALAELGDRARGIAVVTPDITDDELDRLNAAGFRGIRLVTAVRGGVSPDAAAVLARRIAKYDWHIQFQIDGPRHLGALAPSLRALPVPIVIDGMGRFGPEEFVTDPAFVHLLKLLETGRCWVKLSGAARRTRIGAPYVDMTPVAKALIAARPDRLVWGTDWPHVTSWDRPPPNDADLLEWILCMDVDEAIVRAVLVDNPAELYEFGRV